MSPEVSSERERPSPEGRLSVPDCAVVEALERILDAECRSGVVQSAQTKWPIDLWRTLDTAGMSRAWIPERLDGAGATWADGLAIIQTAGRYAAPVPLLESLLAGWVLAERGAGIPTTPLNIALPNGQDQVELDRHGKLTGEISRVGFGRHLNAVVLPLERAGELYLAVVERSRFDLRCDRNLAGEPMDTVLFDGAIANELLAAGSWSGENLNRLGATLRCYQITGALEHLLSRTTDYAKERRQFGRPIAQFQAVQHNLAVLAGEVAASGAAAHAAGDALAQHGIHSEQAFLAAASAKIRCGEAASRGAAIAHQVHGAIGFAREYPLHLYTRRLWAWRDTFGSETEWAEALGRHVVESGVENFWPALTVT